jgi:prepilin-type N-terminal cleavage/methylation domain-containing protein
MKQGQGFSLVEIAIVLVILGFLIGSLLRPLAKKVEHDKIKLTQHSLEEIKQALLGYAVLHGCLPCPVLEVNKTTGKESRGVNIDVCSQPCSNPVKEGFLPWLDLGVGKYDAWGNLFRYRVKEEYTDYRLAPQLTSSLNIENYEGGNLTVSGDSRVVAIIFSYGQNGQPDNANQPEDQLYIQDGYLENQFDDILTWLSKNTVNDYLITAGKKNYALATANNQWTINIMTSYLTP